MRLFSYLKARFETPPKCENALLSPRPARAPNGVISTQNATIAQGAPLLERHAIFKAFLSTQTNAEKRKNHA